MNIPYNSDPLGLLKQTELFALDMDGTFYLGDRLIPGSLEFVRRLRERGLGFVFLTNNSSKSASDYIKKLAGMGLEVGPEHIITSAQATIDYISHNYPGARIYLMGNRALKREFAGAGLELDEISPNLLVTAYDTELDYQKLCAVCRFARMGLPFIATHPDLNCPSQSGPLPDVGSTHALIEASTGRRPDIVIGKPEKPMAEYIKKRTGTAPDKTAAVGDRLYTDIALAASHGMTGVLVLSGEASLKDAHSSEIRPHLIFDRLELMLDWLF